MIQVLIVEDEPLNAEHLTRSLLQVQPCSILGVVDSLEQLEEFEHDMIQIPELIFADIQLKDGLVFQFLGQSRIRCPIIFTTAFDNYYQEAFDAFGIAYLLKPISKEQLKKSLDKFAQLTLKSWDNAWNSFFEKKWTPKNSYKSRFLSREDEFITVVNASDVVAIFIENGTCHLHDVQGKVHKVRMSIGDMIACLDPDIFFQINRGEIVNVVHILKLELYPNDRIAIQLPNIRRSLITSASLTAAFKRWVDR